MDVTVCVGTYGDDAWLELAQRAIASAARQAPVVHVHANTLAGARNAALEQVATEWVIHLDADDELEPGYVEALATGTADVRAPSVRYVTAVRAHDPYVPRVAGHRHACEADCLPSGNWLVVGSAVRADLVRHVGGWREFPIYEDWDLFLRCHHAAATFEAIPAAVYRAHVRDDSRNRAPNRAFKDRIHWDIARANGLAATG